MDTEEFWNVMEQARGRAADSTDAEDIARRATELLAAQEPQQILDAQQILWDVMAASYKAPLWAAAYLINGGCSDDGFEYFRGWLITQGRTTFDQVVDDADRLADLPAVRAAASVGMDLEGERTLSIAGDAYEKATDAQLPAGCFSINYPRSTPLGTSTSTTTAGSPPGCPESRRSSRTEMCRRSGDPAAGAFQGGCSLPSRAGPRGRPPTAAGSRSG